MLFKKVPAAAGCFQYQYTTEKRPCTAGVCRADRRPSRMVALSDLHNSEFGAYNSELVDKVRLFGRGMCCAALQSRCFPQRPAGRFLRCPSPQRHDVLRCSAQKRRCLRRRSGQVRLAHLPPQAGGAVRRGKDQVPVKGILAGGNGFYRDGVGRVRSAGRKVVGTDAHSGAARRDGQRQPQVGFVLVFVCCEFVHRCAKVRIISGKREERFVRIFPS